MKSIIPTILAGGFGTRLWPLSRKSYPKQFSKLIGERSLFQQTASRFIDSKELNFLEPLTLTNTEFRFIVGEQLQNVGIKPGPIIIEPDGKNTGPAILAASIFSIKNDPDAILAVCPSDHVISDIKNFQQAISKGMPCIEEGNIVTFGVEPTRPEIGYGYLELSEPLTESPVKLDRFIEKPDFETAELMLETGRYLWNSGIFLFYARDMIRAFQTHSPLLIDPVTRSIENGKSDLDFWRLDPNAWDACESISVDYAIMEKANNLFAMPFTFEWSDLGDWNSVWSEEEQDEKGVVLSGNATAIDCKNVLLRSENQSQEIVGLGIENIVAIAMSDAFLIANKDNVQSIKELVFTLKQKGIPQAEIFPKDYRPWGWFETLVMGERFQVKRISVKPGAALSLQSHNHRSEHWIVVQGTAKVTVNDKVKLIAEGQSIYIPLGALHRLENPGKLVNELIEIQTGAYLGEDDIIRFEDKYQRS